MSISWYPLIIGLIVVEAIVQLWLIERQRRALHSSRSSVPLDFQILLTLDQHQTAADYGRARLRFGQIKKVFQTAVMIALLSTDLIGFWDSKLFDWFPSQIIQPMAFLGALAILSWFINIPWSWYSHFKLEEKFGFNRMTQKVFFSDQIKGLILTLIVGAILLWPFLWLMKRVGPMWIIPGVGIWLAFQLLVMGIGMRVIAPLFNKFKPLDHAELKARISELVEKAGFHTQGVFVMDASKRSGHGNAYFTGIGRYKRIVFFDTLLDKLSPDQILAVLAHEVGHLHYGHIWKGFLVSTAFSTVGFVALGWLQGRVDLFLEFNMVPTPATIFLMASWLAPLAMLPLTPLFAWRSRKHEFQADTYASLQTSSNDLGDALLSLYKDNAASVIYDRLYSYFFHSHPPLTERLRAMGYQRLTSPNDDCKNSV